MYNYRFFALVLLTLGILFNSALAMADTRILYYEGYLIGAKPKIVKKPKNAVAKCSSTGSYPVAFRLDPAGKGMTVSFGSGVTAKGTLKKKALSAKFTLGRDTLTLQLQNIEAPATKVSLNVVRDWGNGLICSYPFSAKLERAVYTVSTEELSSQGQ